MTEDTVRTLCVAFEAEHEQLYGHRSDPDIPVEVVAVRLVGRAGVRRQEGGIRPAERSGERQTSRQAYFGSAWGRMDTPVIARGVLAERLDGPLLVDEYDSTVVVPPDMRVWLDDRGHIVMASK